MRSVLAALAAVAAMFAAVPAVAGTFITFSGVAADGSRSWDFGNTGGILAGAFTDTFDFILPFDGTSAGSVQATFTSPSNDLDFTAVDFNGNFFTLYNLPNLNAGALAAVVIPAGIRTLTVKGISPGPAGSYSGHLSYTPVTPDPGGGAVPEPATWAMMIVGFGGVGAILRRQRANRQRLNLVAA